MIEMLGVLAIIGVLSIGVLTGYKIAMNYYRANETIHDVMLRAFNVPMKWEDYAEPGLDEEDYYDETRIGCCALDPWKTPGGLVEIGMYRMFGGGMLCCPDGETTYAFKSADTCEYSFGHECFAGEPDYVYCSTTEPQSSKNDCLSVAKSIETGVYRDDFVLDTGYECVSFGKDYCPNGYSNWKGYNFDYDTDEYVECKENVCDEWKRECVK